MIIRKIYRRFYWTIKEIADPGYVINRVHHVKPILQSDYPGLLFHDKLNFGKAAYKNPQIQIMSKETEWTVFEIDGHRFVWPTQYEVIEGLGHLYYEIFAPANCNPHAYEYGRVRIGQGDWVVDAGACEGFFTQLALDRGANVLAIEPVPKLAEALSLTFEDQIRQGRVKVLQGALGDKNGQSKISVPSGEVYCSSIGDSGVVSVNVYSLDELLQNDSLIPSVNFVKMDIEGGEIAAIEGAKRILRQSGPKLSIAVYHATQNARSVRAAIRDFNPEYVVRWRGIFVREDFGLPRPYMLHAFIR